MKKNKSKPKVLFIMHLPPPVHGAAMVGNFIKNSKIINDEIQAAYINLATNTKLSQSGKASFKKFVSFFLLLIRTLLKLTGNKFDICYISLTSSGPAFRKDALIVFFLKLSRSKIIYHFHNKGVAQASQNRINNILYKMVFKNSKTILLSPYLYPDVKQYLKESDVFYCPNGIPAKTSNYNQHETIYHESKHCVFLYLSNMMYQKGVYILLDALKYLKDQNLSFECHFVGGWSDITEEDFKQKVEKRNLSEVIFAHGPKYKEDKKNFFDKANVFIFPTFYHYEGLPL